MPTPLRLLAVLLILAVTEIPAIAQRNTEGKLVRAQLLADTTAIVPGQSFQAGLLLEMADGWHTYWEYSGDAGLPTSIEWELPEGFTAGPILWPVPEAKLEPGDIQTYAYSGRVLLLTTITPPAGISGNITLKAKADWLVCKETCIPGGAEVELTLPVAVKSSPANAELFEEFRAQLPSEQLPPYPLSWKRTGQQLTLEVGDIPANTPLALYPLPDGNQQVGHPVFLPPSTIQIECEGVFRGVLAIGKDTDRRVWVVSEKSTPATAATPPAMSLWLALLYGFLGGLILNLMPCVLPVISLKIFGFIRQAGDSRAAILSHGLAFTAGIFAWFLGLAAVIIALKSGGSEVTWAFQFQNPWFNIAIGSIVFVFALNLAGVFEFVLPGKAATAMENASSGSGLGGSFFQGVFATLLATPCTAPFLGSALGFAFSQSSVVILAMFASVALGMALPYLLLSAQPGWMQFLPRPGAWMECLKQFMAFPLLATLVWILSILGGQRGVEGIVWFSAFLLCLAFSAWLYGAFCGPLASSKKRALTLLLIALTLTSSGWYFLGQKFTQIGKADSRSIVWVDFTEARVKSELAAGRSVFIDFTADWCITCKFNERSAIDTPAVRSLLAEKNIIPVKADWTNSNPEITVALRRFGRVGVPLYVLYPATDPTNPILLPELLTESILLNALKNLP